MDLTSFLLQDFSQCSEDSFLLPSVSSLVKGSLEPRQYVHQRAALSPHNLHTGSSLISHLGRFVRLGRVSYTDWSRKEIRKGSSLQNSFHVTFCCGMSHFVQAPCDPSLAAFALHFSSSRCQTSAWIISLLCLGCARFGAKSLSTHCATEVSAVHLGPHGVVTPTPLIFASLNSQDIISALHFATLNSSPTDDRGSCNWPDDIYRPADVKPGGTPSLLRKCSFTRLFAPSTDVIVTS